MLPQQKSRNFIPEINKNQFKSIDSLYNKYAATLYGYIFSVVKDSEESENILIKIFSGLEAKQQYLEQEGLLLKYIRTANKTILKITKIERRSFLSIIYKTKEFEKVEN